HLYYPLVPPLSSTREWYPAILGICGIRIDIRSLQKYLNYPRMPVPSRPAEWSPAIFGICCIGIDFLSLQKHLYYLLMSSSSCPCESRTPRAVGCIYIPFPHL